MSDGPIAGGDDVSWHSGTVRALTGGGDQADDLVQDAIVRLLTAQDQFKPGTNFLAWAIAILRNRFIDPRRRARYVGDPVEDVESLLRCERRPSSVNAWLRSATAADRQYGADCVGRLARHEPEDGLGDLLGRADALHRNERQ